MLAIAPDAGWSQAAPQPSLGLQSPARQSVPAQPAPQQIEPPPPREENPGLINEIGKLFEKSKSLLPPLKSPGETMGDLNAGALGFGLLHNAVGQRDGHLFLQRMGSLGKYWGDPSEGLGSLRGNTGVTEFTVWPRLPLFVTAPHNVRETPVEWESLKGR